jgi:hypothetical protein
LYLEGIASSNGPKPARFRSGRLGGRIPLPSRQWLRTTKSMSHREMELMSATTIRLGDLAHARSGDKGNRANIGVVANDPACYAWLDVHLTERAVAEYLGPLGIGQVRRYSLPKISAFNFVIDRALAGGASRSLRLDSQGKALGAALLELRIPCPDSLEPSS